MMKCTFEIWLDGQWKECCTVEVGNPDLGGMGSSMLDYDIEYAFSETAPVSLRFPVSVTLEQLPRWPSFLFDLVPQGKGRHYLLGELGLGNGIAADWPLLCAGAFNPIGRLRVKEAVDFYKAHVARLSGVDVARGFSVNAIVERSEEFIEHLHRHSMLSAGTPGVQGVAPKFLLTMGIDGLWYADGVLPDEQAQKHYLVKLPRGKHVSDVKILQNEAAFMRVAKEVGIFVHEIPELQDDMLFIPRFDRRAGGGHVERLHQESAASLIGQIGFDAIPAQNEVLAALRKYTTNPTETTVEFLKRDVLNIAMGNTDNHARNTAVQIVDGRVQLTPLFDFAPMNLDREGIARTLRWKRDDKTEIANWVDVLQFLEFDQVELGQIGAELLAFEGELEKLPDVMRAQGVDDDIINQRYHAIQEQREQLRELGRRG
jgi:serine/threonine-protein kinase HipA